jgi:hypothetical protein
LLHVKAIAQKEKAAMAWRNHDGFIKGDKGPERGIRPLSKSGAAGDKPAAKPSAFLVRR